MDASFITAKNNRTDNPRPINLLKFCFGSPVYLSDRDVTPSGGAAHSGLVKQWGFIDTGVGRSVLGSIEIHDFEVVIINTETSRFSDKFTVSEPPENITAELYQWFYGITYAAAEPIFRGVVYGAPKYDEYTCTLTIRGIFQKYNKKIGTNYIITPDDYPDADPDVYGQQANIIYGHLTNVPCHAIVAGDVNSLADDITAAATSIVLSDSSYFPASGVAQIGDEQVSYTGNGSNTLTGCTRGYNSTTASAHAKGVAIWEVLPVFVYLIAGHPVKQIDDIYVDGLRVTSICTKYTGQSGNELSGYEGLAVFTVPYRLTISQAIDLLIEDGIIINDGVGVVDGISVSDALSILNTISVSDGISVSDTIGVTNNIGVTDGIGVYDGSNVSDTIGVNTGSHNHTSSDVVVRWEFDYVVAHNLASNTLASYMIDGNATTSGMNSSSQYTTIGKYKYEQYAGTPYKYRLCTILYNPSNGAYGVSKGSWITSSYTWEDYNAFIWQVAGSSSLYPCEAWLEITYTPSVSASAATGVAKTGSATKTGTVSKTGTVTKTGTVSKTGGAAKSGTVTKSGDVTRSGSVSKSGAASKSGTVTRSGAVTLSGNSAADVRIGQYVVANVYGYQDDGSGTYTGSASALIERPDHVIKHIWAVQMGASIADVDSTTFTAAESFFSTNSYAFAFLINDPILASDLLANLAIQCRSRFIVSPTGKAKLIVRQLNQSSGHAIIADEIKENSLYVERSDTSDLFNRFTVGYDVDPSADQGDLSSYYGILYFSDATSITRYGTRDWQGDTSLFCFNAIPTETMATHVGTFYLDFYARVRRKPTFGVFLDNIEIQAGDIISVTYPLDAMSGTVLEVEKIIHHLGNASMNDWLEITGIENGT